MCWMSPPRHYRTFHESRNRSLFCAVISSWPQTNAEESWFLKLPYLGFRGSSPQTVVLTFSSHDSRCPALSHMLWERAERLVAGPDLLTVRKRVSTSLSQQRRDHFWLTVFKCCCFIWDNQKRWLQSWCCVSSVLVPDDNLALSWRL